MSNAKSSRRRFIRTAAAGAAGLAMSSRAMSAPPPCIINVNFEGMMVFHKNGDEYEVGIVDETIAEGHKFSVSLNGNDLFREQLSQRRSQASPDSLRFDFKKGGILKKDIGLMKKGHGRTRLKDDEDGQFDFDWMADFESKEFHNGELYMEPNKLRLIIRLSYGTFYTKYKIAKLTRTHGTSSEKSDLGFIAETVTWQINLKPHEEVVVSYQGPESPYVIEYEAGETHSFDISNVMPEPRPRESDFHHYYRLFPRVMPEQQYEIQLADPLVKPLNHYKFPDSMKKGPATVGDYPCAGIRLGTRKQPLA